MPYLSSERVAEIRKQIRAEFPKFKFSITSYHGSGVKVDVLSGPIDFKFENGHSQINQYYIKDHYQGEEQKFLSRIYEIANEGNGVLVEDGDYGTVPEFYVRISIGKWDKDYQYKA